MTNFMTKTATFAFVALLATAPAFAANGSANGSMSASGSMETPGSLGADRNASLGADSNASLGAGTDQNTDLDASTNLKAGGHARGKNSDNHDFTHND